MDRQQFDALSRRVDQALCRRSILQAPLLVTVLAGSLTWSNQEAAGKRKKKACKSPRIKCGKKCLAAGRCCTNADCTVVGQVCVSSRCECPGGQVVDGNECAEPCSPACGDCQRCDDGACVDLADDTPCTGGGTCQAGLCKADRSFGCPANLSACTAGPGAICPDSTTSGTSCFIDAAGDSVCGTGQCTNLTTDAECVTLLGAGAFVLPCSFCSLGGKTRICVKPVTE